EKHHQRSFDETQPRAADLTSKMNDLLAKQCVLSEQMGARLQRIERDTPHGIEQYTKNSK
ncbi:MAG: hypothetical protein AAFZ74_19110, partial [Pseudomonadota bacterium]